MRENAKPILLPDLVEESFVEYTSRLYPEELEACDLQTGVYHCIAKRLGGIHSEARQAWFTLLQFVFAHNRTGMSMHLLPKDGFEVDHPQHWIRDRVKFLLIQPDLPLKISNGFVGVSVHGQIISEIMPVIQATLDASYLKQAGNWSILLPQKRKQRMMLATFFTAFFTMFSFHAVTMILLGLFAFDMAVILKAREMACRVAMYDMFGKERFCHFVDLKDHITTLLKATG